MRLGQDSGPGGTHGVPNVNRTSAGCRLPPNRLNSVLQRQLTQKRKVCVGREIHKLGRTGICERKICACELLPCIGLHHRFRITVRALVEEEAVVECWDDYPVLYPLFAFVSANCTGTLPPAAAPTHGATLPYRLRATDFVR
jgi:hypothetical protein